jgi:WD40 repeat protein
VARHNFWKHPSRKITKLSVVVGVGGSAAVPIVMVTTTDLHLQDGDHPRRILQIDNDEWIAWGGDSGVVAWQDKIIRHWSDEDSIRAVAQRGRQVALGFESGDVLVYRYETSAKEFLTKTASNMLVGPRFETTVRDLTFYDDTTLVIASEDGLTVWNMETDERWLEDEAKKHHDGSGIRALALRDSLLVSLAMDGRWCLWDLKERTLVHRGDVCFERRDVGEFLGADAWDRSCKPLFMSKNSLLLPGASWPQLRLLSPSVKSFDDPDAVGHIGSIVAAVSRNKFVITIGRDKRVVLWSISKVCPKATATF